LANASQRHEYPQLASPRPAHANTPHHQRTHISPHRRPRPHPCPQLCPAASPDTGLDADPYAASDYRASSQPAHVHGRCRADSQADADPDTEETQSRYRVDIGQVQTQVQTQVRIRIFRASQRPGPDAGADSRPSRRSGSRRLISRCRPKPTIRYCGVDPTLYHGAPVWSESFE
jgi:hypothetical protein